MANERKKRSDKPAAASWKTNASPSISTLLHADYVTHQQQGDEKPNKEQQSSKEPATEKSATASSSSSNLSNNHPTVHQQISKEAMLQMMNRGQGWPLPNFGLSLSGKGGFPGMNGANSFPFPINGMPMLPNTRPTTQAKVRTKKRKEKEISQEVRTGEESEPRRMQCWNCAPDCPNRLCGPEKHHVAGMCGRCHQKWQKHPKERWEISHCVSKCRCDRCETSRANPSKSDEQSGLVEFQKVLEEVTTGQGTTLLHLFAKHLMSDCEKEEVTVSSLLTLSSLVGVPCVKLSSGLSAMWEPFVVFSNDSGLPGVVLQSNATLSDQPKAVLVSVFDIASIPFFFACCIQVNVTGLPHETCCSIKLKHGAEMRKAMVRFNSTSDFQVYLSPVDQDTVGSSIVAPLANAAPGSSAV